MRTRPILTGAGAMLLLLAVATTTVAVDDGNEYISGSDSEKQPDCEENQPAAGTDSDSAPFAQEIRLEQNLFGERLFMMCSGEHWDGQDPNTRESESNTSANEDDDGEVYVNPLGDCSGWEHPDQEPERCRDGVDRPTLTDPLHLRVTADSDSPATGEDGLQAEVYFNGELWGVGRMSLWIHPDHDDRNGAVAVFLEDHSDQIFSDILGDPLNTGDGNYLAFLLDPVQQGSTGSGDCSQSTYQEDEGETCPRDNGAFTVHYGYKWAPSPGTPGLSGPALP